VAAKLHEVPTVQARQGRWRRVAPGVVAGLYLSRIIAESSSGAWRLAQLLPLSLAITSLTVALLARIRRPWAPTWPWFMLAGYVLWPWTSPSLAVALLLVSAGTALALSAWRPDHGRWLEATVFGVALALYVSTLAPTVLPADSGEFQLVSNVLGMAHPPGYPLYTLLGKLFTLLPIGDRAWRVNLFAAVCGALTLAVVAGSIRRVTGSVAAALVGTAVLGLSATFWAQSTVANIRSLTALLTASCLALLLRWGETQSRRDLIAFGVCFGLGVGHHPSISLLGLPFLAYLLVQSPGILLKPRRWAPALAAWAASLLVLLYLPIRSLTGVPGISSWADFANYVLALGFRGDVLHLRSAADLAARVGVWANIMQLQFGPVLPWAMLLAVLPLARRDWRALLLLAGTWAVNAFSAITYRAPQTVEYLIPSYVALAMLLGHGLGPVRRHLALHAASRHLPRRVGATLAALLLCCGVANGLVNYPSFRVLHRDTTARDYAQAVLQDAPPNALVLSNWHRATSFWYLQQVEGLRPDVEVAYVHPEGARPNQEVWLGRIEKGLAERPVVVTNRYHAFEHTEYRWVPLHGAWLVRRDPLMDAPQRMVRQESLFEERIRLLGYELRRSELAPGETVELLVYWQPTSQLHEDYSTFAQVLGPEGVVGQGDIMHRSSQYLPGEIRVDLYRFPLLLHTPPGEYQLITGFYLAADGGWQRLRVGEGDHLKLTGIRVRSAREPVATLHPLSHDYDDGLRLTGLDYDRSLPGQTRLYLHWQRAPDAPLEIGPWRSGDRGARLVRLVHGQEVVAQATLPDLEPGATAMLALDVPDGLDSLSLNLVRPDGKPVARLGPWHREIGSDLELSLPQNRMRYVPLGGEMAFIGFDDLPQVARRGQETWLRPRFLSLRPLTADYSVSVGLARRDLAWEQKVDGTPALGAIPTLKWLQGWQVDDDRRLTVEADAPSGRATATLAVYDAFTLEPLPVLDERLVREGMGVHLELDPILVE